MAEALGEAVQGDLATKADLVAAKSELKTEGADLRTDFKTEIAGLRTELKTEIAGTKSDLPCLSDCLTSAIFNSGFVILMRGVPPTYARLYSWA